MIRVPEIIEDAVWAAARRQLGPSIASQRRLVSAIIERSRLYTSERSSLAPHDARDRDDLAARAVFFTVADAAKVFVPLAELDRAGRLPRGAPLRVLDVGAGVGAMTLGMLGFFATHGAGRAEPRSVHVTAVDRDAQALAVMTEAVAALPASWRDGGRLDIASSDLDRAPAAGPFELILAGTVFNELPAPRRQTLVGELVDRLSADGALIIIEPALRETSRALSELRDHVVETERATVFAPCTRRISPCPALAEERDWCHEDRPAMLPPRTKRLADATGLRQHGLKFSYLVLRRGGEHLVGDVPPDRRALRVVSRPRKLKGRRECFACGDHGRTLLRLLKRNRSDQTRPFERAARGDVIVVGESDELGDTSVALHRVCGG